jgi:hypothetical protein
MAIHINRLLSVMHILALWHQNTTARNNSCVLFRKSSIKELSDKIVHASREEFLIRSNEWRTVAAWWHELVRMLRPDIRLNLHQYIDAGNKICFDVMWIREQCLCEDAVARSARIYRDHRVEDMQEKCAYVYQSAQVNCLRHSILLMALFGEHKEIAREYFDHPDVRGCEDSCDDIFYVRQAYHALWDRVSRELEIIHSMCCEIVDDKVG